MKPKIYVASRVLHAPMWRRFREAGFNLTSSWIDAVLRVSEINDAQAWANNVEDVLGADALVLYVDKNDLPIKGALVEVGVALGAGKYIALVMKGITLEGKTARPIGSWIHHPSVRIFSDIGEAMTAANAYVEQKRVRPVS